MLNPTQVIKFIVGNDLGYTLGHAVRAIVLSKEETETNRKIQHLKDARLFINDEIKRLGKEK